MILFILRKYANADDVVLLKWLLIKHFVNFNVLELVFKGFLIEEMPKNLKLKSEENGRTLLRNT